MRKLPDPHHRHRFPVAIIAHAVWLYHTFALSRRDVELRLAERGIIVSYGIVRLTDADRTAGKKRRRGCDQAAWRTHVSCCQPRQAAARAAQ
jgi:transposase-like protein